MKWIEQVLEMALERKPVAREDAPAVSSVAELAAEVVLAEPVAATKH